MTGDWQNRGGTVTTGIVLTPMDLNIEHQFELTDVESKLKQSTPYGIKDQILFTFTELGVPKESAHRVWLKFNESYTEKSNLVAFIKKVSSKPILPGVAIKLGEHLAVGMKVKVLVQARISKDTGQPSGYYDFIPASIKPATETRGGASGATIADALVIAKGAKTSGDAFAVMVGKVPNNIIQEFVAADKRGEIKYPIA